MALQKDRSKETAQMRRSAAQLTPSSVALTRRWSERVLRQAPGREAPKSGAPHCVSRGVMGLGENVKYAVKRYPTLLLQKGKARVRTAQPLQLGAADQP